MGFARTRSFKSPSGNAAQRTGELASGQCSRVHSIRADLYCLHHSAVVTNTFDRAPLRQGDPLERAMDLRLRALKQWIHRLVALEVAWCLLLAVCAVIGRMLGIQFWPATVAWLLMGLVLMIPDSHGAPIPSGDAVDLIGALKMLWWAALWPMRLFRK